MDTRNEIEINPFRQAVAIRVAYRPFVHDATMTTRRKRIIRFPYMTFPHCTVAGIPVTSVLLMAG
jgi:hypothetical protein